MSKHMKTSEFVILYSFALTVMVTLFAVAFLHEGSYLPVFNPVIGVTFGLFYIHGKKVLPSLISGFLLGHIVLYLFIDQREVPFAIVSGLSFSALLTVELIVGRALARRWVPKAFITSLTLKHAFSVYAVAAIMALMAALSASFIYYYVGTHTMTFLTIVSILFVSHFLSITTFAPIMYLSRFALFVPSAWKSLLKCMTFVALFIFAIFYILQDTSTFVFYRHNYILVVFYILAAAWFSYFTLLIMTVGFMLVSTLWYLNPIWSLENYLIETYTLIGLAHISVALAIVIKWFFDNQKKSASELETTNANLDTTLTYAQTILELSNDIMSKDSLHRTFADKTYGLIKSVFDSADLSFAYLYHKGVVEVIDSGPHSKTIPWLYDLHDDGVFKEKDVVVIDDVFETLRDYYGTHYVTLHKKGSKLQSRIYLTFRFSQNEWLIVGLDYHKALNDEATSAIERMHQLTTLLNRLFTKHFSLNRILTLKKDIILTLVRTLDLYDKYTKGHSETVAHIAKTIGEAMGLEGDALEDVYWAGILHDIGKLGVDHDVLNSENRLTDEEYETIKQHVDKGYGVLNDAEALESIAKMMRDHHERVDGKGYPQGLAADEITLGGKILAVADAVATMASSRPYQTLKSQQQIIDELCRCKHTQFSGDVADTAIDLIRKELLL